MVERNLKNHLEPEVIEIFKNIGEGNNFLLSGGAGSGKTYSLIETIKEVFKRNSKSKIACITYTNAAVEEINERFSHDNLRVSTIHSFLWDTIKQFDIPLKESLLELINDETSKIKKPNNDDEEYFNDFEDGIDYQEFTNIDKGIISHDAIIELSEYMYKKYKLLCDIFKDQFDFVFIDEYQDTHKPVIEIFLNHLDKSKKDCVFGFFGDSMQSIYNNGVGDLEDYNNFVKIEKTQNRRNPLKIIELGNKLRDDGLIQKESNDFNAPNMENDALIEGSIKFLYSSKNLDTKTLKKSQYFDNWDFKTKDISKELYLTHKLISKNAKYPNLLELYDKDNVVNLIYSVKKKINNSEELDIVGNDSFEVLVQKFALEDKINSFTEYEIRRYDLIKKESWNIVKSIKSKKEMLEKIEDMDEILGLIYKSIICLYFYENKDYLNLMETLNKYIKIDSIEKKNEIRNILEDFSKNNDQTVGDIFNVFKEFFGQEDILKNIQNKYYFEKINNIHISEAKNLVYRLEEHTPYSTQHSVKGTEYKNVFVILDNGQWNQYNFSYLFSENPHNEKVYKRTKKLFYVCCTRAIENLAVFYPKYDIEVINTAKKWFGADNVHEI